MATKRIRRRPTTKTTAIMATIGMLALLITVEISLTAVEGQAAVSRNSNTIGNNTTNTSSSGIELSSQPVYQEQARTVSQTPINQTHITTTFSGTGILTIPNNDTEAINTTSNGSTFFSFVTQSAQGKETIRTEDGSETATATFYEIVQINPVTRENKGIVIAVVHTNSTGILAPLNGIIVAGIDNIQPNGDILLTFWEWESGIGNTDIAPVQEESTMNTTSSS
ncbi:MAG: hypothetical protein M3299_05170 [Thermoproteota archaeon]|nr:hypothetical protein [Thermoproteota archaeon]